MFRILHRNLRHNMRTRELITIDVNVCVVLLLQCQNPHLKSISNLFESKNPSSLTVDYLINSCGLSPETALSASKNINLSSTEKADSVLTFFQNHGFTKTQITQLISRRPSLLLSDPIKFYKPKIDFFHELGVSRQSLSKVLVHDPKLLARSMKNQIIPSFNFLKSFIYTNDNILAAFKRSTWIFHCNLDKVMRTNIMILQDHSVPNCNISKMFITHPRTLIKKTDQFKENVDAIKEMGFDPSSPMFVHAVRVLNGMSKSSWEGKLAVFQSLGLAKGEILLVFKKQPSCFLVSEKKLRKGVEFFVEKFKWKPVDISIYPSLLMLSLEKRIVPRCTVLEILSSKGMIMRKLKCSTVLLMAEKDFLDKFVMKYRETIPEVVKAYKGEIEFGGFREVGEVNVL